MDNYNTLLKHLEPAIYQASKLNHFLRENKQLLHTNEYDLKLCNFRISLYENIIRIAKSIFRLHDYKEDFFSLTVIGSLTRAILEAYRPFYSLTIENIEVDYRNLRMSIFHAYGVIEAEQIALSLGDDTNQIQKELSDIKKRIDDNIFFQKKLKIKTSAIPESLIYGSIRQNQNFSKELKNSIVKHNGCYSKLEKIISERTKKLYRNDSSINIEQVKKRFTRILYKYFSNYVHSSAICISHLCEDTSEFDNALIIMTSAVIFILNLATLDIFELYPSLKQNNLTSEFEQSLEVTHLFADILTGKNQANVGR